jgi:hypothetical protein
MSLFFYSYLSEFSEKSEQTETKNRKKSEMNATVMTYGLYLLLALPLTVWVARNLFKNGRIFLVECFRGNEPLADSVNQLLVVGFYLVNFGFVALYLKLADEVVAVRGIFEALSGKLGVVLLVLGAMHFFNLLVFTRLRRKAAWEQAPPPLPPGGVVG